MKASLLSVLIIASSFVSGCAQERTPSRYLIPQGYVGWVRVDFNVVGVPQLQKEAGYWNFRFPDSGKIQTSSDMEYGAANDEYYYYSGEGRSSLQHTGWGGGGFIWAGFNGKREGAPEVHQYFFVGTEAQLSEFGWKSKDEDGHPKVGNLNL